MGAIPQFQPHQPSGRVGDYDIVAAQKAVGRTLDEITNRPQLSGEVLQNPRGTDVAVALVAGRENLVEHGLGATIRGWRLADIRGPSMVWRVASPTTSGYNADRHLALACSANVTVKIEVWR